MLCTLTILIAQFRLYTFILNNIPRKGKIMGYTNYYTQNEEIAQDKWDNILKEYRYLQKVMKDVITDVSESKDEIAFNGVGNDSHETFILTRKLPEGKPYDIAVWHMLTFVYWQHGTPPAKDPFSIGRDGWEYE
jgi:hypothetical protein